METALALKWVLDTAKADASLVSIAAGGFYEGKAPIGTTLPYFLVVAQLPATDSLTGNRRVRLMTRMLFQIKMVGLERSFDTLISGANRIDALFGDRQSVALTGGTMLASWRENEIFYPDPKLVDGKQVRHLGGLYHIELKGS